MPRQGARRNPIPQGASTERKTPPAETARRTWRAGRVVLRVKAEHAFRVFDEFPEQHLSPQPDGTVLIDEPMPINEWLTGCLLSFADGLEVIEPLRLRDALKEKIRLMKKKYDNLLSDS